MHHGRAKRIIFVAKGLDKPVRLNNTVAAADTIWLTGSPKNAASVLHNVREAMDSLK